MCSVPRPPDYYRLLDIPENAGPGEIRAAYRRLARAVHPDRSDAHDANARMALLNEAHAVLSDPGRRSVYDRELAGARRTATTRNAHAPGAFARARAQGAVHEHPPRVVRQWVKPDVPEVRDWYAFLGVDPEVDPAAILAALQSRRVAILGDLEMGDGEREWNLSGLREARDVLGLPAERGLYDRLRRDFTGGSGQPQRAYDNWYAFLGVRPSASAERIAARVTDLAGELRPGSRGARYLQLAWNTLRDPGRRVAYDATLG